MVLSDISLKTLIASGQLGIDPLDESCIQPGSVDCRLGDHFLQINPQKSSLLTLNDRIEYDEITGDTIVIPPHSFLLATTREYIKLPTHITGFVEGRSSIGRMGLFVQNAGWIDAGFEGKITLELYNANQVPIQLEAGRRICQLVFVKMDQPAQRPYSGKYQGQNQSVGSRIHKDFEKTQCPNLS